MSDLGDSDFSSELMVNEPRMKNENYLSMKSFFYPQIKNSFLILEKIVLAYSVVVFFEHFRLNRETVTNIRHTCIKTVNFIKQKGGSMETYALNTK